MLMGHMLNVHTNKLSVKAGEAEREDKTRSACFYRQAPDACLERLWEIDPPVVRKQMVEKYLKEFRE